MVAMLHGRNNSILFLWDKMFILMQNFCSRHAKILLNISNPQPRTGGGIGKEMGVGNCKPCNQYFTAVNRRWAFKT